MERALTTEESSEIQLRLWRLLARQVECYTMGESTSVAVETAQAMMDSIRMTLEHYFAAEDLPPQTLLRQEPELLLRLAQAALEKQVGRTRMQYLRACRCLYQEESRSLRDTLRGIGGFFTAYDLRYFAAECPCDIDYQLMRPVPETLRGVHYLRAYLDRLLLEDAVLRRLHPDAVRRVLAAYPEHQELLVNLCEPVFSAALGITLVEGDLFTLDMTCAGQQRLTQMLSSLRDSQRKDLLLHAGRRLAERLEMTEAGKRYLIESAAALLPRVETLLHAGGGWQPLFPAFS